MALLWICVREIVGAKKFEWYLLVNTSSISKHRNKPVSIALDRERLETEQKWKRRLSLLSLETCFRNISTEFEVGMILKNERFSPYTPPDGKNKAKQKLPDIYVISL